MKKFLTALLLVTTIFLTGCSDEPSVEVTATKVLTVDKMTVNHGGKISLGGEQKILSRVSGNVVATYFNVGQAVVEGQPLFKIGKQLDDAQLLRAKASLAESMTALAKETAELHRAEAQLANNAATAREVDEKKFAADNRRAEVDERQALVQKLEDDAAIGIVYAPTSGQIGDEHVKLGATVTADETVLATIGRSDPVVVRFEISDEEKHCLRSSPALKITMQLADGTIYPHEGKLNFDDTSTVEAVFDNPDGRLISGAAVQLVFDGVSVPDVLFVPESAIQRRDGENFVFVVTANKTATEKKISLGGKIGTYFIVNDGLKADDSVVVEGLTNLREGTPLKCN